MILPSFRSCVDHTPKLKLWIAAMKKDPVAGPLFLNPNDHQHFMELYLKNSHEACDYGLWGRQEAAVELCMLCPFTNKSSTMPLFHWVFSWFIGSSFLTDLTSWPNWALLQSSYRNANWYLARRCSRDPEGFITICAETLQIIVSWRCESQCRFLSAHTTFPHGQDVVISRDVPGVACLMVSELKTFIHTVFPHLLNVTVLLRLLHQSPDHVISKLCVAFYERKVFVNVVGGDVGASWESEYWTGIQRNIDRVQRQRQKIIEIHQHF